MIDHARPPRLRIAMVAPPWYPVPPQGYGGTELVVHLLARELRQRGHEVTLFAAEGSDRSHEAHELAPARWSDDLGGPDESLRDLSYTARVSQRLRCFRADVVHEHSLTGALVRAATRSDPPSYLTLHRRLREADLTFLHEIENDVALIGISHAQVSGDASLRCRAVIHHAYDDQLLAPRGPKEDYLVNLARIHPDKGQHIAVEIAHRLGMPLVLAGKIDPAPEAREYFVREVEPHLENGVTWHPSIHGIEKATLLAQARAMLFPIQWEEPFGLAMIEAMGAGTPVVASRRGAAPEIIDEGLTGFTVDSIEQMADRVRDAALIDPGECAARAHERFSPARMARDYEALFLGEASM